MTHFSHCWFYLSESFHNFWWFSVYDTDFHFIETSQIDRVYIVASMALSSNVSKILRKWKSLNCIYIGSLDQIYCSIIYTLFTYFQTPSISIQVARVNMFHFIQYLVFKKLRVTKSQHLSNMPSVIYQQNLKKLYLDLSANTSIQVHVPLCTTHLNPSIHPSIYRMTFKETPKASCLVCARIRPRAQCKATSFVPWQHWTQKPHMGAHVKLSLIFPRGIVHAWDGHITVSLSFFRSGTWLMS